MLSEKFTIYYYVHCGESYEDSDYLVVRIIGRWCGAQCEVQGVEHSVMSRVRMTRTGYISVCEGP